MLDYVFSQPLRMAHLHRTVAGIGHCTVFGGVVHARDLALVQLWCGSAAKLFFQLDVDGRLFNANRAHTAPKRCSRPVHQYCLISCNQ